MSTLVLSAIASVACTQPTAAPKSGDDDEHVATTQEKLGEIGCGSVALHTPQQGGAGNDGLVDTGLGDDNCTSGRTVFTSASYPGDATCPNQAIYELDNTTGSFRPSVLVPESAMPKNEQDCSDLFIKYGIYAKNPKEGGNWDLIGTKVNHLQWFPQSNQCGYGNWTGNAPDLIDMSKYPAIRIAAAAFHGLDKTDPLPITYIPVMVTVNSQYCIW
ncbi:MAG TPA: hypothetical protein VGI39_46655 [Polyangiaceae bacterium]